METLLANPGVLWPIGFACTAITIGWVLNNWLKMRNGYPLEDGWGRAVHPSSSKEQADRITLLTQENASLRAELGAIKDRLANVERIVTDDSHRLTQEINALMEQRAN